jgi:hypothetical protein
LHLAVSLAIGAIAGLAAALILAYWGNQAGDLTWPLVGARRWLLGQNPYTPVPGPSPYPYDHDAPLYYPFPAVLLTLPLVALPDTLAGAIWVAITIALMTFALLRDGMWRLWILLSVPLWAAVSQVQWSPLLICAWYWPTVFFLALAKPTLGLSLFIARPRQRAMLVAGIVLILSLLLFPFWPFFWRESAQGLRHFIPALFGPGFFLMLALWRWKYPEARLLLLMALMPQRLYFYDQLPLLLIATNQRQQIVLVLATWAAFWATVFIGPTWGWPYPLPSEAVDGPAGWIVLFLYGAALILVLWNSRVKPLQSEHTKA